MGEFRRKAIIENAEFVFHAALARIQPTRQELQQKDRLFLLRTQLLAVMVTSFVQKKKSKGSFRKKAMAANIDDISEYLADGIQTGDTRILKVA